MIKGTNKVDMSIEKKRWTMKRIFAFVVIIIAFLAGINTPRGGESIPGVLSEENILSLLETYRLTGAHVGVVVQSLQTGDIILEYNADRYFIPASTMKPLLTFAALNELGPDFRFRTEIYTREEAILDQGVLDSDILVKGYGDPTLGSGAIAHALAQAMPVTTIIGNLYLDLSYFDDIFFAPGWTWDWHHYHISAIAFRMQRPTGRSLRALEHSLYNPDIYLHTVGKQIRRGFIARGITITGDVREGRLGSGWRLAASIHSPSLSEILRIMNSVSDNFIADQLFKALGASRHGQGSFLMGSAVVRKSIRESVGVTGLQIADGSGLSRFNLITPSQYIEVLTYAFQNPESQKKNTYDFEELKGVFLAGENRFIRLAFPLHSRDPLVYAKTGRLSNVATLAGFLVTENQDVFAFAMFVNHAIGGSIHGFQAALLAILETAQ